MASFDPIPKILPVVRPQITGEAYVIAHRWIERYYQPPHKDQATLWADCVSSVKDYWEYKTQHPNSRAGVIVTSYYWAPYVLSTVGMLTLNPVIVGLGVALWVRQRNELPGFKEPYILKEAASSRAA